MPQAIKLQQAIESINRESRLLFGQGKVADYIPALAKINPKQFGMAICDLEGRIYSSGDAKVNFSIQSISNSLP